MLFRFGLQHLMVKFCPHHNVCVSFTRYRLRCTHISAKNLSRAFGDVDVHALWFHNHGSCLGSKEQIKTKFQVLKQDNEAK